MIGGKQHDAPRLRTRGECLLDERQPRRKFLEASETPRRLRKRREMCEYLFVGHARNVRISAKSGEDFAAELVAKSDPLLHLLDTTELCV